MINSSDCLAAQDRLTAEAKTVTGRYEKVVCAETLKALNNFCAQSEMFTEAVCLSQRTLQECLTEAVHGVRESISDIVLFGRAVRFYLPTADVRLEMRITTEAAAPEIEADIINLEDFL